MSKSKHKRPHVPITNAKALYFRLLGYAWRYKIVFGLSILALVILSGVAVDELLAIVVDADVARLVRIPGIGRKTAERLVMELRDKVDLNAAPAPGTARPADVPADPAQEAVSALIALGYKPAEASRDREV